MKQLTDEDIEKMSQGDCYRPSINEYKEIRAELHLSKRIPHKEFIQTENVVLDLHHYTEEEAWNAINQLISSGVRTAKIITGASGILKTKFQQWAKDSIISKYFISVTPINNGSFNVKFRKHEKTI